MTYKNENVECDNKELNRNAYNAFRRNLVRNTYLQIKTFANQNFHFSMGSIFWKRMFMLIKEQYKYLIFFIKFNYLIGPNIIQLLFGFITYSVFA